MTLRAVSNPRTLRLARSSASAVSRCAGLIWSSDTPWRSGYCSQLVHFRHSCESMGCRATFFCAAVSDARKASAASFRGLVETPVCCNEKSAGTTCPSAVTPRNGSAKAFSALAYVFFQPSGIGSTSLLAEPGRGGLTPYPPYLPGMMAIMETLLFSHRSVFAAHLCSPTLLRDFHQSVAPHCPGSDVAYAPGERIIEERQWQVNRGVVAVWGVRRPR